MAKKFSGFTLEAAGAIDLTDYIVGYDPDLPLGSRNVRGLVSSYVQAFAGEMASGSITASLTKLSLDGDEASPGNSKYYGTDGAGAKGFYDLPNDLTIGNAITSGAANRVLYEDASNNLAQSANLTFDGNQLGIANGLVSAPSLSFTGNAATGLFRSTGVNIERLQASISGVEIMRFTRDTANGINYLSFNSPIDSPVSTITFRNSTSSLSIFDVRNAANGRVYSISDNGQGIFDYTQYHFFRPNINGNGGINIRQQNTGTSARITVDCLGLLMGYAPSTYTASAIYTSRAFLVTSSPATQGMLLGAGGTGIHIVAGSFSSVQHVFTVDKNFGLNNNDVSNFGGAAGILGIGNADTDPTSNPTSASLLFSKSSRLKTYYSGVLDIVVSDGTTGASAAAAGSIRVNINGTDYDLLHK